MSFIAHGISIVVLCAVSVGAAGAEPEAGQVSFENDVKPIFEKKCFRCHNDKNRKADLDLHSIDHILKGGESGSAIDFAKPEKGLLYEYIHEGMMPPEDEPPLTEEERAKILSWVKKISQSEMADTSKTKKISQHDVIPNLLLHCGVCHGAQRQEAGLDIRSKQALLKGGKSGPAFVSGKPEESLILKRLHAEQMPPRETLAYYSVKVMPSAEIDELAKWIQEGAPEIVLDPDIATSAPDPLVNNEDRKFWAFQPPKPSPLPDVKHDHLIKTPIDLFIESKLEEKGLQLSPVADRTVLLRRVYLDLIGLPPTPEQIARFLNDPASTALDRVIDELLDSPRYGERWGQYWLDLAGYSDSEGGQNADIIRQNTWQYRDYVIRSFNNDKPYDRFLLEQIAGDELTPHDLSQELTAEVEDNLIATGFLRMAPDGTYAPITGFMKDRLTVIDDEMEIFSSSILGLTMKCARCHTHKFDPIPQRDYYRLTAVFKGAFDENDWLAPNKTAVKDAFERVVTTKNKEHENKSQIRALWDRGAPSNTYLLVRGDYKKRGQLIGPGVPSVLTDGKTPFVVKEPWPGSNKTGRRLALAKWLVEPGHPLTARVIVNRIWKHHFNEGIVSTLDNFGVTGARPTHPELLDWLALQFVEDGWSIKSLHRLILKSAVYQQSSKITAKKKELDPENQLLSRMPLKRMDAEVLRDSLFYTAGLLDQTPFGEPDPLEMRKDGLVTSKSVETKDGKRRRSIYQLKRRTQPLTILENYDAPRMSPNCVSRTESIVAPQALHLLNNQLVKEVSDILADRICSEAGSDLGDQIDLAFLKCLGRKANVEELKYSRTSIEQLMAAWKQTDERHQHIVQASKHLWIREKEPERVFEDDLISVWSQASGDQSRRWGLVEFDLGEYRIEAHHVVSLNLGPTRAAAISQSASLIPPGIDKLTWSRYQIEKANAEVNLAGLGRIVLSDSAQFLAGKTISSKPATEQDLNSVRSAALEHGKLTFVLKADEDGAPYSQDWDDGDHKLTRNHPPQLLISGDPLSDAELQQKSFRNFCHALLNSAAFLFIN